MNVISIYVQNLVFKDCRITRLHRAKDLNMKNMPKRFELILTTDYCYFFMYKDKLNEVSNLKIKFYDMTLKIKYAKIKIEELDFSYKRKEYNEFTVEFNECESEIIEPIYDVLDEQYMHVLYNLYKTNKYNDIGMGWSKSTLLT